MSNYQDFLHEKQIIDELVKNEFKITAIKETFEGDEVEMERSDGQVPTKRTILLTNPDSRKYVTTLLIKRQL